METNQHVCFINSDTTVDIVWKEDNYDNCYKICDFVLGVGSRVVNDDHRQACVVSTEHPEPEW